MLSTLLTIFSLILVILIDSEWSDEGREGSWGGTKIGSEGKKVYYIIILSLGEETLGVVSWHSKEVNDGNKFESTEIEALQIDGEDENIQEEVRMIKAPWENLVYKNCESVQVSN